MEFTAGSCISFGWEAFKKRPMFFIFAPVIGSLLYGIVSAIVSIIIALLLLSVSGHSLAPATGAFIVRALFDILLALAMVALFLKAHDDPQAPQLGDLWHPAQFWNFLATGLLVCAIVLVGLVLLVVPGVIFAIMFMFAPYLVIDRHMGPLEAMEESARITKGYRWVLFLLSLLCTLIVLLGFVCLIIGVFVAVPIVMLAKIHAYRVLSERAGAIVAESASPPALA